MLLNIGTLEIFNYIKSQCEFKDELAEEINDLLIMNENGRFNKEINNMWIEYCEAHSICPCCGSQIEIVSEQERLEDEPSYFKVCPNCG